MLDCLCSSKTKMADVAPNSQSPGAVRITVDPGKPEEERTVNGSQEKKNESERDSKVGSSSDDSAKAENEKNSAGETTRESIFRPSLLLRPSAFSQNSFQSTSVVSTNSPSALSNSSSNNKFASPDESVDSLFNLPSKSDKTDGKPPMPVAPAPIPTTLPLSNPNYVFGQNIGERVTERAESTSNGTGSMLFSSVLREETNKDNKEPEVDGKEASSLLEDAARCQEQRAAKRKYEEVQVTTGEENEINVLQLTVKLFAFEGGSWVERGRGTLRLNDVGSAGSRIVVRTMGNLRVALNTKIWAGMELSRASEKSIRTTAMDPSGTLKIFLIQASPSDVSTLFNCMEARVRRCQAAGESETVTPGLVEAGKEDAQGDVRASKVATLEAS